MAKIKPQFLCDFIWKNGIVGPRVHERYKFIGCVETITENYVEIRTRRGIGECSRVR